MLRRLLALMLVALLTGCGGGGGEESDGVPESYAGNRSRAAITTSNARMLATSAYSGTVIAGTLDVVAKGAGDGTIGESTLLDVIEILENAAASATAEPKTSAKTAETTALLIYRVSGYSGYYDYQISWDPLTENGTGVVSFVNYRPTSSSLIMNGDLGFSASTDPLGSKNFKMSITDFTAISGTTSYTLSGTLETINSGETKINKVTLAVTNNASSLTGVLKDYTLTVNRNSSLTCTGTLYHPIQGFVNISTPSPLSVTSISSKPTSGRLLVTGSNGSQARLTFGSGGYYTVEVDAEGDGIFVAAP